MENKIMKIFHFAVMALALVALVVFAILHACAGLETQISKLYMGVYVILAIWATTRVISLYKDLKN